jgi:hypothetical protein
MLEFRNRVRPASVESQSRAGLISARAENRMVTAQYAEIVSSVSRFAARMAMAENFHVSPFDKLV